MDPCGTPILREDPDDFTLFILTFWILSFRYEAIRSRAVSCIP